MDVCSDIAKNHYSRLNANYMEKVLSNARSYSPYTVRYLLEKYKACNKNKLSSKMMRKLNENACMKCKMPWKFGRFKAVINRSVLQKYYLKKLSQKQCHRNISEKEQICLSRSFKLINSLLKLCKVCTYKHEIRCIKPSKKIQPSTNFDKKVPLNDIHKSGSKSKKGSKKKRKEVNAGLLISFKANEIEKESLSTSNITIKANQSRKGVNTVSVPPGCVISNSIDSEENSSKNNHQSIKKELKLQASANYVVKGFHKRNSIKPTKNLLNPNIVNSMISKKKNEDKESLKSFLKTLF